MLTEDEYDIFLDVFDDDDTNFDDEEINDFLEFDGKEDGIESDDFTDDDDDFDDDDLDDESDDEE